jgi:hypothetical protein
MLRPKPIVANLLAVYILYEAEVKLLKRSKPFNFI